MIITRIEPPVLDTSFETTVTVDTKANMLEAAEIWGLQVPKNWRKDDIAYAMNHCLKNEPQYVWDNLGQEAIDMIGNIVEAGKGHCITVPHNPERFNRLQKSLLVIGANDDRKGVCRLYMLDEVYDIFKKLTDGHLKMLTDLTEKYAQNKIKEIMRSDAKKPKALMKEYFGFDTLPVDEEFEGFGICMDPRDMEENEEQVFNIPQGMSLEDIKAAIERLYGKNDKR